MARARRDPRVYTAKGEEVLITLLCPKCHRMRSLRQFGLRRMASGQIRNAPWCKLCRGNWPGMRRPEPTATEPVHRGASDRTIDLARARLAARGIEVLP